MKQIKLIIALLFVNLSFAQHTTSAKLLDVTIDGLHEIVLPNEIRSFSNRDLRDLRILDSKGKEVPYFIREKRSNFITREYGEFEIISKITLKDSNSTVIVKNPNKTIQEMVFTIANYSGSKTYNLSGSDNQKQWFGLVNNGYLYNLQNAENTSVEKVVSFPLCDYKYLKVDFNDANSLPINVLKIGEISSNLTSRGLQEVTIKSKAISELTNEKRTQLHVTFNNKEIINQIQFKVASPELFNRNATIYKMSTRVVKEKTETYKKVLTRINLRSDLDNIFNIPEIFENNIYIEIENKDDSSLTFEDVLFFQKPLFVVAALKTNEKYSIVTGDKKLKAPQYDITSFKNSISNTLPKARIAQITQSTKTEKKVKTTSFWQQPWFMWLCIIIAGLIILYFTTSLVKDLKKE